MCVWTCASNKLCRLHHPESVSSFAPFHFTVLHCLLVGCLVGGDGSFGEHQARYQGRLTTNQASPASRPRHASSASGEHHLSVPGQPRQVAAGWLVGWMGWDGRESAVIDSPPPPSTAGQPTHPLTHTRTHPCLFLYGAYTYSSSPVPDALRGGPTGHEAAGRDGTTIARPFVASSVTTAQSVEFGSREEASRLDVRDRQAERNRGERRWTSERVSHGMRIHSVQVEDHDPQG